MTPASAHGRVERVLARALRSADPHRVLRRARQLPASVRAALLRGDRDGLRLCALFVARLRFERLLRGDLQSVAWFEHDPEDFARVFRRYHRTVAPTAFFPGAEARLFRAWLARVATKGKRPVERRSARDPSFSPSERPTGEGKGATRRR